MSKLHVVSSSGDGKLTSQHGRTDGRTDEELPTSSDQAAVLNAHTRVQRFADEVTVGDVIAAGELWQSTERHPRVRIGDQSFLDGSKSALDTLALVIKDLTAKIDAAKPGDLW